MKAIIRTVIIAICMAFVPAKDYAQQSVMKGMLGNILSDTLIIKVVGDDFMSYSRTDTVAMNKGEFTYRLQGNKLRVIRMDPLPCKEQPNPRGIIDMVMLPGEEFQINGTTEDYHVSGGKFYQQLEEAISHLRPSNKAIRDMEQELEQKERQGADHDAIMVESKVRSEQLALNRETAALDFMRQHPSYDASAFLMMNTFTKLDEAISLLSDKVKQGIMEPFITSFIKMNERMKARAEAMKTMGVGKPAPDFTLTDINGNPLTLSSLRGKYVVLDFWGSWCGWCIKGFPDMKKYYDKYKSKMEILGIACNDTEAKWKAAVEKHQLPWVLVLNPMEAVEGNVAVMYAVSAFPTKIIISPEGIILKNFQGEDPAFYTYLDELFGK